MAPRPTQLNDYGGDEVWVGWLRCPASRVLRQQPENMVLRTLTSTRRDRQPAPKTVPAVIALAITSCLLSAAPGALADLPRKQFGPGIDPYPGYVGQKICSPTPKPGVVSFRRMVLKAFPKTEEGYFTRSCSAGGQSEHKDGRAWDWPVSAYRDSDVKKVDKLLEWLLNKDSYGHRYAGARRVGLMYLIWNRRIWTQWNGWRPYGGSSPHTDHVHFSFSWPGARKETTHWNRRRSFVTTAAGHPDRQGFWAATGNATVLAGAGSNFEGDKRKEFNEGMVVSMAATASGDGYWLVKRSGKLLTFGDADSLGSPRDKGIVADMASRGRGRGYWIVTSRGKVFAYGKADHYGNGSSRARVVGMARTPNNSGYWLVTRRGRVLQFGNAQELGDVAGENTRVVDIAAAPTQGYWLVSRSGRVEAYGGAVFAGDARDKTLRSPVVAIVPIPSGAGYWLITAKGKALEFGAAPSAGTTSATSRPPAIPWDPTFDPEAIE